MQQTGNYKLNLVEKGDTFSPDPLNENMEKVEAAMDGLNQRIAALEVHRLKIGTYASKENLSVDVGFKPAYVLIFSQGASGQCGVLLPADFGASQAGTITDTGFRIPDCNIQIGINYPNRKYIYFAYV